MYDEVAKAVTAAAIQSEIAHPLGSMRLLPESEEELALTILNALDDAGFELVRRSNHPAADQPGGR
jgi:hypothetical protein